MSHFLTILAQQNDNAANAGTFAGMAFGCCFFLVYFAFIVVIIAGLWKVFVKARQPGWAAIIPIFNLYILCLIAGRPIWWIILFFIPLVNIVVAIILWIDVAKYFGKSTAFAIGLALLPFIFIPILGFGSATYSGPAKPFST